MPCPQSKKKFKVNRATNRLFQTFTLIPDLAKMIAISNSSQLKSNLMLPKSPNLICTKSKSPNCKFWCKLLANLVRCRLPKKMYTQWASLTLRSSHQFIQLLMISLLKLYKPSKFLTSCLLWLIRTTSFSETSWFLCKMNLNRHLLSQKNSSLDFSRRNQTNPKKGRWRRKKWLPSWND